jgi:hypothetical protein
VFFLTVSVLQLFRAEAYIEIYVIAQLAEWLNRLEHRADSWQPHGSLSLLPCLLYNEYGGLFLQG